jgi:hypothetical protein
VFAWLKQQKDLLWFRAYNMHRQEGVKPLNAAHEVQCFMVATKMGSTPQISYRFF